MTNRRYDETDLVQVSVMLGDMQVETKTCYRGEADALGYDLVERYAGIADVVYKIKEFDGIPYAMPKVQQQAPRPVSRPALRPLPKKTTTTHRRRWEQPKGKTLHYFTIVT